MNWYGIVFMAIVVEGVITYVKTLIVDKKFQWQIFASIILGIICAVAYGIDIFEIAGIEAQIPFVGMLLTGVLLSRGSNYIFDLIGQLTTAKGTIASLTIDEDQTHIDNHEDEGVA